MEYTVCIYTGYASVKELVKAASQPLAEQWATTYRERNPQAKPLEIHYRPGDGTVKTIPERMFN